MVVLAVIVTVTAAMASLTGSLPNLMRRQTEMIYAKAIAEAGLNEAYSRLARDFSLRYHPQAFPLTPFGGGTYDVTVTPIGERAARLLSEGRYRHAVARLGMDIRNAAAPPDGSDHSTVPDPWKYAMFANGNLRLNGTPPAVRGNLHTNQTFDLNGNPQNIEGTVTARTFSWSGGQLPPEKIGTFRQVPFPTLNDPYFVQLLQIAQQNGAVRGSGTFRSSDLANIRGGVLWVTGSATFHGSFTFNGVIVVTGHITLRGSGTRTVNGLIYTPGNIISNGSTDLYLTGAMLAGGNIEFNGASSLFTYGDVGPGSEEEDETAGDRIVVSAWWEG